MEKQHRGLMYQPRGEEGQFQRLQRTGKERDQDGGMEKQHRGEEGQEKEQLLMAEGMMYQLLRLEGNKLAAFQWPREYKASFGRCSSSS